MSDDGRGRPLLGVGVGDHLESGAYSGSRFAVRSIAWLDVVLCFFKTPS
jgi:hypothetical protein